jgi:polysaccharide biosynthesis protein PelA
MRFLLILALLGGMMMPAFATTSDKFVIYYSNKAPLTAFHPFKLIILDSDFHPPLLPLVERGKVLLGYISLGEVEHQRKYFAEVKSQNILLNENQNWKGSYFVDARDGKWAKRVIEELVPHILAQGFDGIFLDTLDNLPELERMDPVKYKGMTQAAVDLVKAIRMHFPQIKIMMNRGYELLPEVANSIDMVLGESVYADYNFDSKNYGKVNHKLYQEQVKILKSAKKVNPAIKIYTLDYCNKNDRKAIAAIYKEQRKNGFIPYVATIALNEIVEEPK